jgi:hypothetical protein
MTGAPLNLDDLAARMAGEGFVEYVDFFIANRADGTLTSSELVCPSFRDDVYRVFGQETRRLVDARYPGRRLPEQGDT